MNGVSVIIPARNEIYLEKTMRSILDAAEGEIEIIAVLDGYLPDPPIDMKDDRVKFIHFQEAQGQRRAINEAAKIAKGKYILKTDAHSMLDQGFDIKLAADCEYDWTVIPRMYNLDVDSWTIKKNKRTDFMWIRSPEAADKPFRHNYFDGPAEREFPEVKLHKNMDYQKGDICDVMTGQGACFFMHKDRFWELEGCDERHGSWGQQGVEVALKAWLSGGSLKVNKKTWFAHWFRGGGGPGFPYQISGRDQHKARKYSIDLWTNNRWPLQQRPLLWLVEKFAPLPTWRGYTLEDMKNGNRVSRNTIEGKKRPTLKKVISSTLWINKGHTFDVDELHKNRIMYADPKKIDGIKILVDVVPPLVKAYLDGKKFTDADLMKFPYYDYLVSRLNPAVRNKDGSANPKGRKRCLSLMQELGRLTLDIRDNGLRSPLDMYMDGEHPVLTRGGRRLEIIHALGWKTVPVRIWRNHWLAHRYIGHAGWNPIDRTICGCAVKQFIKYKELATDKYWVHNYIPYYEHYMQVVQGRHIKVLELGIKTGASLALWRDCFPKAQIYGVDKDPTPQNPQFLRNERIHTFTFDLYEGRGKKLKEFAKEHGPWDFIIDDALHTPWAQKIAFQTLWPFLKENGVFAIEDIHGNFRDKYKDNNIIPMLKDHVEDIWVSQKIQSISFFPNICFIRKA